MRTPADGTNPTVNLIYQQSSRPCAGPTRWPRRFSSRTQFDHLGVLQCCVCMCCPSNKCDRCLCACLVGSMQSPIKMPWEAVVREILYVQRQQYNRCAIGIFEVRRSRREGMAKVENYFPGGSGMSEGPSCPYMHTHT